MEIKESMKIELKLSADQLQYLASRFEDAGRLNLAQFKNLKHDRRIVMSIAVKVADKLAGKYQGLSRKPTLFEAKKKHKVSLEYYEAYAVHVYLTGAINSETDAYRKMTARAIHLMIDPHMI